MIWNLQSVKLRTCTFEAKFDHWGVCVVRLQRMRDECYDVLQSVAMRCRVLQSVAERCSVLPCVAVCCSVLQCVAVCCSVLQSVADVMFTIKRSCVSIQQAIGTFEAEFVRCMHTTNVRWELQCVAECCSVMQCVIECCRVLQCITVCRRSHVCYHPIVCVDKTSDLYLWEAKYVRSMHISNTRWIFQCVAECCNALCGSVLQIVCVSSTDFCVNKTRYLYLLGKVCAMYAYLEYEMSVTICCRVLQSVAECCSVMQSVAECCRVLQGAAESCRILQHLAECCSVLQSDVCCRTHVYY